MISITAILRARTGREEALREALLAVADHVARHEPATLGFFLSQDLTDPAVFTTYERFVDAEAMALHNHSPAVSAFFAKVPELLDGEVVLHECIEFSNRNDHPHEC
jgi:quinol monooxygenase YgiN